VLKKLEENGLLKNVREICGVSAGAWLAFMVAAGLEMHTIEILVHDIDFSIVRNITPDAFLEFPETYGIDNGLNLTKFLESVMRVALKLDTHLTFSGLKALNLSKIAFRCWATDLNTCSIREFSFSKTPNVKIIDALRASMALPLYFTPVNDIITGHLLSDGALLGNLPIHHLTKEECEETLGITFSNKHPGEEHKIQDIFGFIGEVFNSLVQSRNEAVLRNWGRRIIEIPVGEFSSLNFEASREERLGLFKAGYNSCNKWLSKNKGGSNRIIRRHSVQ
jgi:NTE family protein